MTASKTTGRLGPVFGSPAAPPLGGITLNVDNPRRVAFTADRESRTITGLALPYGDVAETGGRKYRFSKGALRWAKVRLLAGHDWSQLLGTATFEETDAGLQMTAKVANTSAGDDALALADAGALDGLSVGLAEQLRTKFDQAAGIHDVQDGTVLEVSLTPLPAFSRAGITSVTAQQTPPAAPAAGENGQQAAATFDLGTDQRFVQLAAAVNQIGAQVDFISNLPNTPAAAAGGAQLQVAEESIYRFGGDVRAPSGFDFAEDLLAAARGDRAARARVSEFTDKAFGPESGDNVPKIGPRFVDTGDVGNLAPDQYRPDMFLGDAPVKKSPLYDFFYKGGLSSNQPFFYSVLNRADTTAGVSSHTEGSEPTAGDLVTEADDPVVPGSISGKVFITREVGDRGGSPSASALVWRRFEKTWREQCETRTVALVNAAAASIASLTATIAAGADGNAVGNAIEAGEIGLLFGDYADEFSMGFGHIDLYTALAGATIAQFEGDTSGEKRYPIINPGNRSGQAANRFSFLDIGGYRWYPAASLGATAANGANSYIAAPAAVHVWSSGARQFDKLQEKISGWEMGVHGYFAGVVYDLDRIRKVFYDSTGAE